MVSCTSSHAQGNVHQLVAYEGMAENLPTPLLANSCPNSCRRHATPQRRFWHNVELVHDPALLRR